MEFATGSHPSNLPLHLPGVFALFPAVPAMTVLLEYGVNVYPHYRALPGHIGAWHDLTHSRYRTDPYGHMYRCNHKVLFAIVSRLIEPGRMVTPHVGVFHRNPSQCSMV